MDFFAFENIFIPAAMLLAGILVMFKVQWQAFFYMLAVIYAVSTWQQFAFVTFVLGFQMLISRLYHAVGDDKK